VTGARLLLDTQVFLWFLADAARIPPAARGAIAQGKNTVFVSAATIWEIAIKASVGRLRIAGADLERLPSLIDGAGFDELPVSARHAAGVHALPPHHRDPFDRLLIAQARADGLTIVTTDPAFRAYDIPLF
jgi:PIN domain nuclease of toxin-antitoxin system